MQNTDISIGTFTVFQMYLWSVETLNKINIFLFHLTTLWCLFITKDVYILLEEYCQNNVTWYDEVKLFLLWPHYCSNVPCSEFR